MSSDPSSVQTQPQAATAAEDNEQSELSQLKAMFTHSQQHADLMLRAVQTASSLLELNQVLRQIAEMLAIATGVPNCGIYLLDGEHKFLVHQTGTGYLDPLRQSFVNQTRLDITRSEFIHKALGQAPWRAGAARYGGGSGRVFRAGRAV